MNCMCHHSYEMHLIGWPQFGAVSSPLHCSIRGCRCIAYKAGATPLKPAAPLGYARIANPEPAIPTRRRDKRRYTL